MNNHFTLVITLLFTLLTAPLGFSQSNTITKTMLFSEIQDKFVEGADAHKKETLARPTTTFPLPLRAE